MIVVAVYRDHSREWKQWQRAYIGEETARASTEAEREAAGRLKVRVRQTVIKDLGRVDRCVSCHVSVEDPSYSGMPQPLAYHPDHDRHPFDRFGCTICHRGQGRALTKDAAHGNVAHWEKPMLPMEFIQSACAQCHHPGEIPKAPELARGLRIFEESGCIGCHKLDGVGGEIGPELMGVGAKRSPDWLIAHFKDPAAMSKRSAMPPFKLEEDEYKALTSYILSLTGEKLTPYYLSFRTIPDARSGRRLFGEKGCLGCHRVGGRGGSVGPSLDRVAKRRKPEWIVAHFRDPQAYSPGTVMPRFKINEQESQALTQFLVSLAGPGTAGHSEFPSLLSKTERGRAVFKKYGCAGCHGRDGGGGVPNPNAETAGKIPALKYVAESYTAMELKKSIREGVRTIEAKDPNLPPPPIYMPEWGNKLTEAELDDLAAYLVNLYPKGEEMDW